MGRKSLAVVRRAFGFTILELIIVFAILALLLISGFWMVTVQINKAYVARREVDMKTIEEAVEHYNNDFGLYPENELLAKCGGEELAPYLAKLPCDPVTKRAYKYAVAADRKSYTLIPDSDIHMVAGEGGGAGGGQGGQEGALPTCGGKDREFCLANTCGQCCPGANYKCNSAGTWCIVDDTCGN